MIVQRNVPYAVREGEQITLDLDFPPGHTTTSGAPRPAVLFMIGYPDEDSGVPSAALPMQDIRDVPDLDHSRHAIRSNRAGDDVAIAVRLLRRQCPGLRVIVSFADPAEGHVGAIYQAAGWVYLGQTEPSSVFVDGRGRRWHPRMVSQTRQTRDR